MISEALTSTVGPQVPFPPWESLQSDPISISSFGTTPILALEYTSETVVVDVSYQRA